MTVPRLVLVPHPLPPVQTFPISPIALLEQARHTLPFLFSDSAALIEAGTVSISQNRLSYLTELLALDPEFPFDDAGYFRLCLAVHHAVLAGAPQADLERLVKSQLWQTATTTAHPAMAETVLESVDWDWYPVSVRHVRSPLTGETIDSHHGDWLATAVAAYAALQNSEKHAGPAISDLTDRLADRIQAELARHAQVYLDLRTARDGIGALKAAFLIAQALGSLDRAVEAATLDSSPRDRLRVGRLSPPLISAERLYGLYLIEENHRHFALRSHRGLLREPALLLPIGPFFDDWGNQVGACAGHAPAEVASIVETLVDAWGRLRRPAGYTRALAGILESFPGGLNALEPLLSPRATRTLRTGLLFNLCQVPRARFEAAWNQWGLRLL